METAKPYEQAGEYMIANVSGDSMKPLLTGGKDAVLFKKPATRLKKYDIALILSDSGKYHIRRIIEVKPYGYIVRGDNLEKRERINDRDIIGVAVKFLRHGVKLHDMDSPSVGIYSRVHVFLHPVIIAADTVGKVLCKQSPKK